MQFQKVGQNRRDDTTRQKGKGEDKNPKHGSNTRKLGEGTNEAGKRGGFQRAPWVDFHQTKVEKVFLMDSMDFHGVQIAH